MLSSEEKWKLVHGDCIPYMHQLADEHGACMDFSIFSPPFPQLYAYSASEADIGNSEDLKGEAKLHLSWFYRALLRVMKPGRVVMVHVAQIPRLKRAGGRGLFDFRGFNIRLAERAGFIFTYDWVVAKNPQSQAIRTRSRELQFAGLEADRSRSRGVLPDYLLRFEAPGENAVPIDSKGEVSRNDWIEWAECCWKGIRETDTLNTKAARSPEDTRHICPLQLPVIRRSIKLYSNPGEIVLSPFAGIGSEGHCALELGRRFLGIELKPEYHAAAQRNLEAAERAAKASQRTLFGTADT